jgi:hypothetical protein
VILIFFFVLSHTENILGSPFRLLAVAYFFLEYLLLGILVFLFGFYNVATPFLFGFCNRFFLFFSNPLLFFPYRFFDFSSFCFTRRKFFCVIFCQAVSFFFPCQYFVFRFFYRRFFFCGNFFRSFFSASIMVFFAARVVRQFSFRFLLLLKELFECVLPLLQSLFSLLLESASFLPLPFFRFSSFCFTRRKFFCVIFCQAVSFFFPCQYFVFRFFYRRFFFCGNFFSLVFLSFDNGLFLLLELFGNFLFVFFLLYKFNFFLLCESGAAFLFLPDFIS